VELTFKELRLIAKHRKIYRYTKLSKAELLDALNNPEKYEKPKSVSLSQRIDITLHNPQPGNYVKWWSKYLKKSCEGKFKELLPNGRIKIAHLWGNKWVSVEVDSDCIIDYIDRKAEQCFRG